MISLIDKQYTAVVLASVLMLYVSSAAWAGSSTSQTSSSIHPIIFLASCVVGTVGGAPIAAVRRIAQLNGSASRQWIKETFHTESKSVLVPAKVLTLPFAAVVGLPEGAFYSLHNAVKYSQEEPFSKETFSLGTELD